MNNNLYLGDGTSRYSGQVKISLVKGGVKYKEINAHNNGTTEFFAYILNCVCGMSDVNYRPAYLYLYEYTGSTEKQLINFGILYDGEVSVVKGSDENNPSASLTYKFLVPSTLIKGQTISRLKLKSLSKDNGDYITYATLDLSDEIKIETDTNLEIAWTLILENK